MSSGNFRFLHASDLHLDTPFSGVGRTSKEVGERLRDASLRALDNLVAAALRLDVSFVLLCGDIYDGARYGVRGRVALRRAVDKLLENGIAVALVLGNHDAKSDWKAREELAPGTVIFDTDRVERAQLITKCGSPVWLYGTSIEGPSLGENTLREFARGTEPGLHIGMLHAEVGGARAEHQTHNSCSLSQLVSAGLDYWALGHIHKSEVLSEASPVVIYSGNLQGRSAKTGELGAKGAYCVEVEGGIIRGWEFVPCDDVRFLRLSVDVGGLEEPTALVDRVSSCMERQLLENDGRGIVARVKLVGRGRVQMFTSSPEINKQLVDEVNEALRGRQPFCFVERIENAVLPEYNEEEILKRGDFSSELLLLGREVGANEPALSELFAEISRPLHALALPYELRRKLETETDCLALLSRASVLALDLLEEESS
jgi:DNA repair exonuclease SbcCD nuclease subunit